MPAIPVLWLCISLMASAQTLSDENGGSDTGETTVAAYVSESSGELPENEEDRAGGGAATGDSMNSVPYLLLLCSGGLFVAAAAIGRKGIEDSAGMENREDDSNDP